MNIFYQFFVIGFLPFALFGCKSSTQTSIAHRPYKVHKEAAKKFAVDFNQNTSLTSVLEQASQKQKLVFIDFYADWCTPCKLMDRDVFMHQPTADFLNKHFVSYKVNTEKDNGPDLSIIYDVKTLPALLFLDDRGNVLERKDGAAYHTELLRMANRALDSFVGL